MNLLISTIVRISFAEYSSLLNMKQGSIVFGNMTRIFVQMYGFVFVIYYERCHIIVVPYIDARIDKQLLRNDWYAAFSTHVDQTINMAI